MARARTIGLSFMRSRSCPAGPFAIRSEEVRETLGSEDEKSNNDRALAAAAEIPERFEKRRIFSTSRGRRDETRS